MTDLSNIQGPGAVEDEAEGHNPLLTTAAETGDFAGFDADDREGTLLCTHTFWIGPAFVPEFVWVDTPYPSKLTVCRAVPPSQY